MRGSNLFEFVGTVYKRRHILSRKKKPPLILNDVVRNQSIALYIISTWVLQYDSMIHNGHHCKKCTPKNGRRKGMAGDQEGPRGCAAAAWCETIEGST